MSPTPTTDAEVAAWRELEPRRVALFRSASALPPSARATVAERFFRRPGAPGPAAEHVLQYLVSATRSERRKEAPAHLRNVTGSVAGSAERSGARARRASEVLQADSFYRNQYRQYFSAVMGAFAMTAPQLFATAAAAADRHRPRMSQVTGRLFRPRRVVAALLATGNTHRVPTALLLSHETVAVPVFLPRAATPEGDRATARWLAGTGPLPDRYRPLVDGNVLVPTAAGVSTRGRGELGAVFELVDAAVGSRQLALLALHPYDTDAMGLHITLFGVEALDAATVETDYGLDAGALDAYRDAATQHDELLYFLVGGTAEIFTQCSQNLFVKHPDPDPAEPAALDASRPSLETLLGRSFELLQATADAAGLPGASPRNGQIGRAAFIGHHRNRSYVLIPYHPGNGIHGHAAKLWSNQHSTLMVSDDHDSRRRVTISGPSWIWSHQRIVRRFPLAAAEAMRPDGERARAVAEPVYWFVTRITDVVWSEEPLTANRLTEERGICTIHAGGEGRHSKKAAYFDAGSIGGYDQHDQHRREAAGRPVDPNGHAGREWTATVADALDTRNAHLAGLPTP